MSASASKDTRIGRILLTDDWDGHPLLKPYAVDTPASAVPMMFDFALSRPQPVGGVGPRGSPRDRSLRRPRRPLRIVRRDRLFGRRAPHDEHGAQHPSAQGEFRAILTLEGESVVGVDAVIGYLHRCHEKLAETLTYARYPSIASKTDYVAAMTSEFAYVRAAETIGQIEVPESAPRSVRLSRRRARTRTRWSSPPHSRSSTRSDGYCA